MKSRKKATRKVKSLSKSEVMALKELVLATGGLNRFIDVLWIMLGWSSEKGGEYEWPTRRRGG